ncbi:centrosomal protein of 97 kDa isoform X1 [Prorops nasuta]|uniref:centrosomal protein of 97 kDa isoform X1 n=1 Tax=Prorops nasuta TaxID=863751 RepID=UPI0034CEDFF3
MAATESLPSEMLDLSGQNLKKLGRCPLDVDINTLIVDDNELQRLDNLDSYCRISKLSIVRNQLLRMYGVSKLHNLVTLNLSNNSILTIEGIKDMKNLQTLCLAGNKIKSIEHLHTNVKLEHLDLSENSISHISDISYLKHLQELFLHNNRIITLDQCERYLPASIETLTLAKNNLTDLNEMSHLVNLKNLINFSIANNPCVNITDNSIGFNYRPFLINWCMSLKSIDGHAVDAIESLKAEWLYSQGRGRQFRVGEHESLAQYLASVCPLSSESMENETDKKLRLILSKAQHHQQQLSQQTDLGNVNSSGDAGTSPSPATRRRLTQNRTSSPRRPGSSRNLTRIKSPDRMASSFHMDALVSSCHTVLNSEPEPLMTQSLDPNMLCNTLNLKISKDSCLQNLNEISSPLQAATKLVPVPESLMSPDFRPPSGLSRILPKTAPSKLTSPCQYTAPIKVLNDESGKAIPIINTVNPMAKTNIGTIKTSTVTKSNSNTNCIAGKANIAKPVTVHTNGKYQHYVKVNNFVQSKTLPIKKKVKNPSNSDRSIQRPKSAGERLKSNLIKKDKEGTEIAAVLSSDEDSEICQAKLDSIKNKAIQRQKEDNNKGKNNDDQDQAENAAICIQRMWRGYHARNLNNKATNILKMIEMTRTNKYIQKLSIDMEATRIALENEHKLQLLQMQAINALWKKLVSLQHNNRENTDGEYSVQPNSDIVNNLALTCNLLHSQVQQLQESMSEIKRCMGNLQPKSTHIDKGVATQTEISAVHTPAGEEYAFPYARPSRPQSLAIHHQTVHETNKNKSFASSLVDSVLKKVSQSTDTTDDEVNTDILNSNENLQVTDLIENEDLFKSSEEMRDSGINNAVHTEIRKKYENVIEETMIDGEFCEEILCKELHNLINTENAIEKKSESNME